MPSSTSQGIMGEGEMGVKKVVTICPSAEELRQTSAVAVCGGSHVVCPVPGCRSFTFKNQRSLVQHTNALHPHLSQHKGGTSAKEKSEDCHFHCPQADCVYNSHLRQRWFSSLDHLRYHYINTHDEKRFACNKCGKRFGWKRDQEYHERECGLTFGCGTCPAQYPSRRSLLTHCLRKQHPVPPQFERPAQKVSKGSPSAASKARLPQQSVTSSTNSSSLGVSLSMASPVPSEVSPSVISSTCSGASVTALPVGTLGSYAQSGSTGNPAILLSSCSDIPGGVSIAIVPPAIVSAAELPSAVTASSDASVTTTDAVSADLSAGIVKAVCDSGDAMCAPPAVPLASLEVTPPSADMSLPSSSASTESPKTLHASQPSPRNVDVLAVSLSNSFSLPQPGVCRAAAGSTSCQQVLSQAASTGLSLPEDSGGSYPSTATPQGEAGESMSKLCITQKHSAHTCSNVNMTGTPQTHTLGVVSHITPAKTTPAKTKPAKTTATNTGHRKRLRPILPKSQEVVVVGGNAPALYANPDSGQGVGCVLHSAVLPWIGGTSLDAATAVENPEGKGDGVSAACQTSVGCGSEGGGEKDRVQVPVVHMATQVSGGALHPISICHTGTQVYAPALLRGDSIHTAVQTCVQTTHSGTQLAAPLPGPEGVFEERRLGDSACRQPEVCAVAIQTGGRVDMVNMAIQATAQRHSALDPLSAQSAAGLVLDMIQLCDGQPEQDGMMGPRVISSALPGTHTASQTSFPYIMLNKANRTNSTGTQVATGFPAEELDVASRGMQTSVTLMHRPKLGKTAAQTQTCSDAGSRSLRSHSRASGGRVRKRSTKCSEVQTQPCSPRAKKGRRKGTDTAKGLPTIDVQEISIATQTLTEETVYQAHSTSSTLSMPHAAVWASRNDDKPHKSHRSGRNKSSKSSKANEAQTRGPAQSAQYQQNPPLSAAATQEEESAVWDPFFSSPVTAPSSPPPQNLSPRLEDLLSEYRVELGVQTPQDFLSEFTADFGMQTMGGVLCSTSDLAVQTLDMGQQPCTAELGVQTVTSALGCLLDNLEADFPCSSLDEDILYPTPSSLSSFPPSSSSDSDAARQALTLQSIKPSSSAPQVHSMGSQAEMFDLNLDGSIPSPHIGVAPKLFDSFDSDLSFSDCGTGTEDFFASTHTQTSGVEVMMEDDRLSPPLSSLYGQSGLEASLSLHPLPHIGDKGSSAHSSSQMDVFATSSDNSLNEVGGLTGEPVVTMDFCPSPGASQPSRPTSSSTTDTDLLSGVPATDMHTQTADDLLTFLMNNMETQTTEDLCCDQIAVADTHTQTSTSVLLTPPHPLSSLDSSSSWLGGEGEEGVVSAETQTSAQLMWDLQQDQEELFDLTDMETQTMLW